MKKKDIAKKVTEILVDKLGVEKEEVNESANLQNDLGMDGLDAVELIMECEQEVNIAIPDDDAETVQTVGDIINYLFKSLAN